MDNYFQKVQSREPKIRKRAKICCTARNKKAKT